MKRILLFADVLMSLTNQRDRSGDVKTRLNRVFTGKVFSYMLLFILFLFSTKNYGQCAYPAGATQVGSTITYCIDNSGTISNNVPAGRFVLLNVISGFTYRFRVNNEFGGTDNNEIVSIYNASNNNGLTTSGNSNGIDFNWTATLSGQVKVLVSRGGSAPGGCVNDGSGNAQLRIDLVSIGNNIDSQTGFGTNTWRGHIYNAGGVTPAPFTNANYAGYYDIASETINENFGSSTACIPVFSQSSQRASMYTEGYAVRYRMKTTKSGCYFVNFRGDDGIRLTLNGTSVFDRWVEQGPTNYSSVLVRLDGDDDFVLDYYENTGQNEVGFSLTPFDANANTITAPTTVNLCSNGNPTVIEGSLQYSSTNASLQNPQLNFQWQLSTDGGAYANISGATERTYDPPAIANATSANIVRRFKRLVTLNTANVPDINGIRTNCLYNESNVVTITTSPTVPATPGAISGTAAQCPAVTGQVYSVAAVPNALSYAWAVPSGWAITSGLNTNSITVTTSSSGGTISVTATNGCGTSAARTLAVTVNAAPTVAAISTPSALCSGGSLNPTAPTVTANGSTVTAFGWQLETAVASGAYSNLTVPYTVAFADNGKRIRYYATNTCGTTNSNVVTLTVNAAPTIAAISAPAALCSGGSLNPTAPTVTANGSTVTASGWQLETAVASDTYSNLTVPYTVAFADNGKRIRYYATNTCGTTNSNVVTLTVNTAPTIAAISAPAALCSGGSLNPTAPTVTANGSTVTAFGWQLETAVASDTYSNLTVPYTVAFADNGKRIRYYATNTCGTTNSNVVTLTVNPLPSSPTVGTITDVTCSSTTGSVVLSGLPSGSWTINQDGTNSTSYSSSGSSYTVTGLAVGGYTFTVSSGGCTSSPTSNVPIVDASSTTWDGSSWSNGAPDATKNIIIASSSGAPFAANLTGCALMINTGVTATVPSGVTLTITNAVTTNGQLIFENNASLVQTTNASNTGAIEYRRISSPMKNFDYTYWSSPVSGPTVESPVLGQTAKLLSPNTLADKYFRFDGDVAVNDWVFDDGVMTPGVGFIIRVPKPGTTYPNGENWNTPTYSQPVAFKGTPNNGDYTFNAGAGEFNLIGNPYPSAIDADEFIRDNSGIINGALFFWTHNTAITNNEYTADDYASYTLTGSTGTGVGNFIDANNNGSMDPGEEVVSNKPLGKIAAGQSFFVESLPAPLATQFVFNNSMRVAGNNSQFFKQANTKKTATVEKNRVWLNLTNSKGAFKQLLVGYITGATNDWDNMYDGPTFDGQEFVDFYSVNQGKNLTIQGRALPFADTDVVPLGYRSTIAGSFDISIDSRDGALAGQEIWLEDKKTNTLHELSKGKYTFTAINGVENDRFVLKYTNKTLGTDDNEVVDKSLIVSVKNKKITLISSAEAITQVQIFDLLGRKVYDKSKINAQEWSISNLSSSEQTLIVKTTLANGAISNKKIIY